MVGYSIGIFRCTNFIARPLCLTIFVFVKNFENQWATNSNCDTAQKDSPENRVDSSLVTYVCTYTLDSVYSRR
jgi:hypothetical protein